MPSIHQSRSAAQRKLAHAERMIDIKTRAMARLVKSVHEWRVRASRYAKRAMMTDAQLAAEREQRQVRIGERQAKKVKRAIVVGGAS